MSFCGCAVNPCVETATNNRVAHYRFRNFARLIPVAIAAITLGACNQYTVATNKSGMPAANRQVLLEQSGEPTVRHVAVKRIRHTPLKRPIETQFASHGIASFYSDEQPTASGERFDPSGMTAAHRSLPFGTRLRVTNLTTGRSVTVRVNDRGPYIAGRVVDVSYSAAESLGIVGRG
ncbi:MAG: septal ring lytic transglycosylase RlpA family protein, partial [Pseudolabrys sp.]